MNTLQSTIAKPVKISGIGLHTGKNVNLKFIPAEPGHGIIFQRVDLENKPTVEALVDWVVDTSRGTTLEKNGARVATVEHVLASLVGLEIDNVLIELDGPEIPIMDGSADPFIHALKSAGIKIQDVKRKFIEIHKPVRYVNAEKEVDILIEPNDCYILNVDIDFRSKIIGRQQAELKNISDFDMEIAPCRTFCFFHELEMLVDNNLIKGGDLDNAIVIVDREVKASELERLKSLFHKKDIEVRKEGILNNVDLRFENEPARHKLLDIIGDLALVGGPIKGKVTANRPGHFSNVELVKKIKAMITKNHVKVEAPYYDPDKQPVCDINRIKDFLPHKYPFLLVDKIIDMSEVQVTGAKNVTYNEHFFQGHFPTEPVFPGVLIIEAMAQCGGILVMNSIPDPENYTTYFLKIDKAKFKQKVVPGDTLLLHMELVNPIRRGICEMKGRAFVGSQLVAEAELVAQITKKEK